MIGLLFVVAGLALLVAGLVVVFGPWAAVACGAALVALGLFVPWEELKRAESAATPPRR